jgi:hypothetical protein
MFRCGGGMVKPMTLSFTLKSNNYVNGNATMGFSQRINVENYKYLTVNSASKYAVAVDGVAIDGVDATTLVGQTLDISEKSTVGVAMSKGDGVAQSVVLNITLHN